jgi:hypothetical protein
MSYSIRVKKTETGIQLLGGYPPEMLKHIPDGVFVISGHNPLPDTSPVASLAVTLVDGDGDFAGYIVGVSANYTVKR